MDRNYEKNRIDLCGDAVVDFINADSTDEACLSLIPKIQIEHRFSTNFTQNARNTFPFLEHITDDLHQWQRRIIDLYFNYWTAQSLIEASVWHLMLLFWDYDFSNDKLILQKESDGKLVRISLKDVDKNFKKIEKKIINSCPSNELVELWENTLQGPDLYDHITDMRKYSKLIPKVECDISAEQQNATRSLLGNKLLLAHSGIRQSQVVLKKIINRAIKGVRLDRYLPFTETIRSYQESLGPSIDILPEGNLKFYESIKKEELFTQYKPPSEQDENRDYFMVGAMYIEVYVSEVNHFFVEFLRPDNNISRFHHCKNCDKYFIISTKRKAKFCSKKCRQDWNNKVRIKSGEHAEYKRKKRMEGAKESYYG